MEKTSNKEAFNIFAGILFANMLKYFPLPSNLIEENFSSELKFDLENGNISSFFLATIEWLETHNYIIAAAKRWMGQAPYMLTEKALIALNKKPHSLGGDSFGDKITKAAKDITTEAGKKALGEQVGEFFGSAMSSFTKGMM